MSYEEFYQDLEHARERTGTTNGGAWYRGISDGRHVLRPSLLRNTDRHAQAEINMFADFWGMIDGYSISDNWQRLSLMQHYGVPTRLLDWTTSVNVALYFAMSYSDRKGTGDPCIWVLNPFKLNALYCGKPMIFDEVDRIPFDYYHHALSGDFPNEKPIALRPLWSNQRVRAQSGAFTFHASFPALEDMVNSKVLKRVQIKHSAVRQLRQKILEEGTDHFRMLGGPDGLALFLKRKYLR